ncbi:hypothetical protein N7527_004775 [Penicillium freii]|nr:hypothetical protein N7527_004775 [Penicillium freii]
MTSPSSTILIEDDELPPSWRSANSQVERTSPRTSPEILIEPNDATSGSIEPSPRRKRAKRKQPDTLDTCFKKLLSFSYMKTGIERSFPDVAFWIAKSATNSRIVGTFYCVGI